MITTDEIARLRALIAAATPDWRQALHIDEPCAIVPASDPMRSLLGLDSDGMAIFDRVEDAALAVAAVNALPALLDALDEAHAAGFREAIDAVAKMADETAAAWDETRDGKIHPTIAGSFRKLASWARTLPAPAPEVTDGK